NCSSKDAVVMQSSYSSHSQQAAACSTIWQASSTMETARTEGLASTVTIGSRPRNVRLAPHQHHIRDDVAQCTGHLRLNTGVCGAAGCGFIGHMRPHQRG